MFDFSNVLHQGVCREAAAQMVLNPVISTGLSVLACFSIPSHFSACLEPHVGSIAVLGIESL